MLMVMCRACGEFVTVRNEEGSIRPLTDECPNCGGRELKNIHTEDVIHVE